MIVADLLHVNEYKETGCTMKVHPVFELCSYQHKVRNFITTGWPDPRLESVCCTYVPLSCYPSRGNASGSQDQK